MPIQRPVNDRHRTHLPALLIECIRATLLAKQVTATRPCLSDRLVRPSCASLSTVRPSTIDCWSPAKTPASPTPRSRVASVSVPRTGALSNFQSPVCNIVPAADRMPVQLDPVLNGSGRSSQFQTHQSDAGRSSPSQEANIKITAFRQFAPKQCQCKCCHRSDSQFVTTNKE